MTHRGPFQPLPFCDSVRFSVVTENALGGCEQGLISAKEPPGHGEASNS